MLIEETLKKVLPLEKPCAFLLNELHLVLSRNYIDKSTVSPKVIDKIRKLMESLPSQHDLSQTKELKKALLHSGLFLEQHLLNNHTLQIEKDLKAQWLILLSLVKEPDRNHQQLPVDWLIPENLREIQALAFAKGLQDRLLSPTKGNHPHPIKTSNKKRQPGLSDGQITYSSIIQILARILAQQLNSLSASSSESKVLLDIPAKINESFQSIPVLIQQDAQVDSLMLAIDLEPLGALQVKVSKTKNNLSLQIWSNKVNTNNLLAEKDSEIKEKICRTLPSLTSFYHLGLNLETNAPQCKHSLQLDVNV